MGENQDLPSSRKDALAQGATFYFNNNPCKHGHLSKRRTISGTCQTCHQGKTSARNKTPKRREYMRRYCKANAHRYAGYSARRRAAKLQATPAWADEAAIAAKYELAKIAEKVMDEPHHVDHIVPLQGDHVCGLHVAENLRVIPAEDNLRKRNSHTRTEVAAPKIN